MYEYSCGLESLTYDIFDSISINDCIETLDEVTADPIKHNLNSKYNEI